ncbi:uncharacterized protein UBRO_20059 [Ustilago bromivora]|uniref:Uncharacterized protein n=1 Tax=Ustilago bromivora TaxID=307758 RepID=A0A1K0HD04_9BASI|nr:uncharacterized protein UBRO_20059 [Ustilago bromivora]
MSQMSSPSLPPERATRTLTRIRVLLAMPTSTLASPKSRTSGFCGMPSTIGVFKGSVLSLSTNWVFAKKIPKSAARPK